MNKDVIELYPNIYQIVGRKHAGHAYLVRGSRRNVLIDTGLPTSAAHLEACLGSIGLRREDIKLVILTHEHIDHAGAVPFFADTALIAAHRLAANKLVLKDEFALMNRAFDAAVADVRIDILVDDGAAFDLGDVELQILHTPGHCSGAICVYEPTHRLLFSGDTIMAGGIVGGVLGSGNVSDYIDSLKRLAGLRIALLYPGHGRISTTPESDLQAGIDRLQELLGDAKALFDALKHSRNNFDAIMRSLRELNH